MNMRLRVALTAVVGLVPALFLAAPAHATGADYCANNRVGDVCAQVGQDYQFAYECQTYKGVITWCSVFRPNM
ncbi:hypothetical protein Cs7R123_75860 [Catellatospora sp. TT07R-123]|nr:hypothetical protein Cs7R123_75860 [Catellatospora sp. TT07R-123]